MPHLLSHSAQMGRYQRCRQLQERRVHVLPRSARFLQLRQDHLRNILALMRLRRRDTSKQSTVLTLQRCLLPGKNRRRVLSRERYSTGETRYKLARIFFRGRAGAKNAKNANTVNSEQ